jgi:hypothetical protein
MCEPGREACIWHFRQEALAQGEAAMPTARVVPRFTMVQSARIDSTKLHFGKEEET